MSAGACDEGSDKRADQAFADYRGCLTGGPLDEGETLTARLENISLAFPEQQGEWPKRCDSYLATAFEHAADDSVMHDALASSGKFEPDEEAWAAVDARVRIAARASVEAPPDPIRAMLFNSKQALFTVPFGSYSVKGARHLGGHTHRFLVKTDSLRGCTVDSAATPWSVSCDVLEQSPPFASYDLLDIADGAGFLVESGKGVFRQGPNGLRKIGNFSGGRAHLSRQGVAYVVNSRGGEPRLRTHQKPGSAGKAWTERTISRAPGGDYHHGLQLLGGKLLWVEGKRSDKALYAAALEPKGRFLKESLGPVDGHPRIGASCDGAGQLVVALWNQPDHERTETRREAQLYFRSKTVASVVKTSIAKPASTRDLLVFQRHGDAPLLQCIEKEAVLSVLSGTELHWSRCDAKRCQGDDALVRKHRGRHKALFLGQRILVVRADRGLRMRLALPSKMDAAIERVLVGPISNFELLPVGDSAILWFAQHGQGRALRIEANGTVTALSRSQ